MRAGGYNKSDGVRFFFMRILITGGAGFIASHLADRYLKEGHEVAVLDDLSTGAHENVPRAAAFYRCDIRDAGAVTRIFGKYSPEVVSHHAAHIDVARAVADPTHDASINVSGALNMLVGATQSGVRRFLFASSGGAVYGQPRYLPVDEKHPVEPASPYGLTKFAFENYLRMWSAWHEITPVILRYANVYGPRQGATGEGGAVAVFSRALLNGKACRIFGDGTMTRDYVFVDDVVEANVRALTRGDGEILNIGTGEETSTQRVFEVCRDACHAPDALPEYLPEREGEVRNTVLDSARARRVLGWQARVRFEDGVPLTVQRTRR